MIPRNRPARIVAAVGATVAAGATAMLAVTTTASADEPGRCLQNVNIREEPDAESRIVALCEAGTEVALGEERDGFVRVDELGGWAAEDYVKADETSSSDDRSDSSGDDSHGDSDGDARGDSHDSDDDAGRHSSDDDQGNSVGDSSTGEDGESAAEATDGDGAQLDGLLS